jgi:hypothetical protein
VAAVLLLRHEQEPVEQLDGVVLVEETVVEQPPVLGSAEASYLELVARHRAHRIDHPRWGQRHGNVERCGPLPYRDGSP